VFACPGLQVVVGFSTGVGIFDVRASGNLQQLACGELDGSDRTHRSFVRDQHASGSLGPAKERQCDNKPLMTVHPVPQIVAHAGRGGEGGYDNLVCVYLALLGPDRPVVVEADVFSPAGLEDFHSAFDQRGRECNEQSAGMDLCLVTEPHGTDRAKGDWHIGGKRCRKPCINGGLSFGAQRVNTAGIGAVNIRIARLDRVVEVQLGGELADALQRILVGSGIATSYVGALLLSEAEVAGSVLRGEFCCRVTGDG